MDYDDLELEIEKAEDAVLDIGTAIEALDEEFEIDSTDAVQAVQKARDILSGLPSAVRKLSSAFDDSEDELAELQEERADDEATVQKVLAQFADPMNWQEVNGMFQFNPIFKTEYGNDAVALARSVLK